MVLDLYGPKILVIQIWGRWAVSFVAALVVVMKVCLVCLVWLLVVGGEGKRSRTSWFGRARTPVLRDQQICIATHMVFDGALQKASILDGIVWQRA